ncbi:hypothetical protein [Priestia flexa]|jgi:hypothetical protein|uniref:hypothetical protein n=1 Tax=Priestia flexa TaxID=86664 RepID=UPI0010FBEA34|nr:hypothetical protein [Priestia flexa]MCG7315580.1 hypothetical protein [Priestia flexa]QCS53369.1 hypothetical protein FED53_12560 [Priestia flexa]
MSEENRLYSVEVLDPKRNVTYYRQYDALTIEEAKQKAKAEFIDGTITSVFLLKNDEDTQ